MKRQNKIKYIGLLFTLVMVCSFGFQNINTTNNNSFSNHNLKTSSISFDESSLSVPYGTNIQEDRTYAFSGVFHDTTNKTRVWTDPCYLETKFVLDPDVNSNDTITTLDNIEVQHPSNSSFSMIKGSQYQNGTLDILDDVSAIFNSTTEQVKAENFTLNYGNEVSIGDMEDIDGDYSEYSSDYYTSTADYDDFVINQGVNESGSYDLNSIDGSYAEYSSDYSTSTPNYGVVNVGVNKSGSYDLNTIDGSYAVFDSTLPTISGSGIIDFDGGMPDDFTDISGAGCTVNVISSFNGRSNVLELYDDSEWYEAKVEYDIVDQADGYLDFWVASNNTFDDFTNITLVNELDQVITCFGLYQDYFYEILVPAPLSAVVNDQWYNIRVEWDCSTYDNFSLYIDDVFCQSFSMVYASDSISKIFFGTYHMMEDYVSYIDTVDIGLGGSSEDGELDVSFNNFVGIDLSSVYVGYSLKTNISQTVYVGLYNFDTLQLDLINSSVSLAFTFDGQTVNSSYLNSTGYMWFSILASNSTNPFELCLEMLIMKTFQTIELISTIECDLSDSSGTLFYSYKTNITQLIQIYLFNFSSGLYILVENSSYLSFNLDDALILSDYYNSTAIKVKIKALNQSFYDFALYLEVLIVKTFPTIVLISTIECDVSETFFYSFKTNITQLVEIYLFNFSSGLYILVENSSYLSFNLNSILMISDYYNSTTIKVKIKALNQSFYDFALYLEVLKIVSAYEIDFTMYVELEEFFDYLLQLNATAWYRTSIYQTVNFSIYDVDDEEWININSSVSLDYSSAIYFNDTSYMLNLINEDDQILFRFKASNSTYNFSLFLDKLEVETYRKLLVSCDKIFTLLGTWKYRFHVPDNSYYTTDWIYFDVVLREDNVEIISESDYLTSWEFVGGYDTIDLYQSDFYMDSWNLHDVDNEIMKIDAVDDRGNYIGGSSEDFVFQNNYSLFGELEPSQHIGITSDDDYFYLTDVDTGGGAGIIRKFNRTFSLVENITHEKFGNPYDIEYYDDHFYINCYIDVGGYQIGMIQKYTSDFSINVANYSLIDAAGFIGMAHNGTNWFLCSAYGQLIFVYDNDWVNVLNISLVEQNIYPVDIACDGVYYYMNYLPDPFGGEGGSWINKTLVFDKNWNNIKNHSYVTNHSHYGITFDIVSGNFYVVQPFLFAIVEYKGTSPYIQKFGQLNDRVYMQTNVTETISMETQFYDLLSLLEGYKIKVTFNTSSSSEIRCTLLNSNTTLKEFIISEQGNINYLTRSITVNMDSDYTFDKIRFSSLFSATDNLIISDIVAFRYDVAVDTYELNPKGLKTIYLTYPFDYAYYIYENDVLKDSGSIITTEDLQTLSYERIGQQVVYITYHDSNNEYLNFQNYITYANFSLDGVEYEETILTNDVMYVDVETEIDFMVYDSFNVLIKESTRNAYTHMDIILPVYLLKIKNEATENVNYTLSKGIVEKTGSLFSQEIAEFSVSSGNYSLVYLNHENNEETTYNFILSEHKLITIETTYRDVYFSIFSYDGLGLDHDLIRFYINNDRRDLGFNTMTEQYADLLILDFFNNTLFNETIDTTGLLEYSMFVDIYTLNIVNLFVFDDLIVNITQEGSGIWMNQLLPNEMSLPYRFLPNINYTIFVKFLNDTIYDEKNINLTANGQIESFGVTEEYPEGVDVEFPEYPKDVYIGVYEATGLGIDLNMVKLYLNNTRTDFGFSTFESDALTNITVKDYFDSILFTTMLNVTGINEYNIEITLFSLKIKNEATKYANYSIQFGLHITDGYILPEEIIEYQLSPNSYVLEYTNTENNVLYTTTIDLTQDNLYVIPSTYRDIYFSLYTYDGFGIDHDTIKFYINGSRKDLGFNTIESEMVVLTINDFFGNLLYSNTINCYELIIPEYSIFIEIYTLSVVNLYKGTDLRVIISQDHTDVNVSVVISSQTNIPFRLVPNLEYTIKAYDLNDTYVEEQEIDLEDNNMIINFGFYEETITVIPEPFNPADYMIVFYAFIVVFSISIGVMILYLRFRSQVDRIKSSTVRQIDQYKETDNDYYKKKIKPQKNTF